MSRMLAQAHQRVLCGVELGGKYWSKRAQKALETLRMAYVFVEPDTTTILEGIDDVEVWNFAGGRANRRIAATLEQMGYGKVASHGLHLRVDEQAPAPEAEEKYRRALERRIPPDVDPDHPFLRYLKFAELLPSRLLQEAAKARLFSLERREPGIDKCFSRRTLRSE